MKRSCYYAILLLVLAVSGVSAQVATGTPPFGSFGGGPFDTVNLGNLNAHFAIPIVHKSGRGVDFNYALSYDSSVWTPVLVSGQMVWQPAFNWGWTAQTAVSTGYISYTVFHQNCDDGSGHQSTEYRTWIYHDPWGVAHGFGPLVKLTYDPYNCAFPPGTHGTLAATATDGSGVTLSATLSGQSVATHTITTKGGAVLNPPVNLTSGYSGSSTSITDANGNQISVSSTSNSATFTDTLGSAAITVSGTSPVSFSYSAPLGPAAYTLNYKQYTVKTNFGFSGTISEYGPLKIGLVDNIQLPDGSSYSFTYEQTPGTCSPLPPTTACVTGRILKLTLPAGGTVTYGYTGGTHATGIFSDGSTSGLTRTLVPGGEWQYSRTLVTGSPGTGSTWTTTVIDPSTSPNYTVINSAEDASSSNPTYNFYETQRQVYQGSVSPSNLLATSIRCYNTVFASCATTTVSSPITQTDVYSELPNNSTRLSEVTYNGSGLVTDDKEYDYGVTMGAAPGNTKLVRETAITYAALGNGIVNKPASVIVYDYTSGTKTKIASRAYTYDQTTPAGTSGTPQHVSISGSRGNLTTLTTSTSSTATLSKTFTYYDTGNPHVVTDVNGAQTTYVYAATANPYNPSVFTASCGNAFATTITEALSRSVQWDCYGGLAAQLTDENTQVTSTDYNDPYFWRPDALYDQESNKTTISYSGQTAVETALQNFNSGNSASDTRTTIDGFGRLILNQRLQGPGATNYDTREVDYNAVGQPYKSTMPFSAGAGGTSSTAPATTTTYDAMGRILTVTDASGGTLSYTYTNNDVLQTVTGTQSFQKQFEYDGLGRLTSVCELSSTLSGYGTCAQTTTANGFWTKYTYDAMGHLLTVTQNAQATSNHQTRTFTYDWLGRMTSESNPETSNTGSNGTKTYVYDTTTAMCMNPASTSNGDLLKVTDAAGNCTMYYYDALHRVTDVGNSSQGTTNPCKRFRYDNSAGYTGTVPTGITTANTLGRLREVLTDVCVTGNDATLTDEWFSYSPRGELTDVYELTPHSGTNYYYHTTAAYWPTGTLETLSGIPGVPTLNYGASGAGLDGEGRLTQVTASSGTNPVTGVTYSLTSTTNPLGSLTNVTFGSTDSDSFSYDPNTGRMTGYTFSVNSQTDVGAPTWNPNGTLSKLIITDNITGTNDSQTCNYLYDDLQRVSSSNCGALWSQTFTYDSFGNVTKTGNSSFTPGYSLTQNQFTSIPGRSVSYDGNGNLTTDNLNTYTWDVYGNLSTVNGGAVGATYDALGRMVEKNVGGSYSAIVYAPTGDKVAVVATASQTLSFGYIKLPGGAKAVYQASGLAYFRHSEWLGSSRLASTSSRAVYASAAYAPFGEAYGTSFANELSFTGQNEDTVGSLYDFPARRYSQSQGRWISPDPLGLGAVTLANPQSWNRYAYVLDAPLLNTDPTGLDCVYLNDAGDGVESIDQHGGTGECASGGGFWIPGSVADSSWVTSIDQNNGTIGAYSNQNGFLGWTASANNDTGVAWQTVGVNDPNTNVLGNVYTSVDDMSPSAQSAIIAIAKGAPTLCGGGAFGYYGKGVTAFGAKGFTGGIVEADSQSGISGGSLNEIGAVGIGGGSIVSSGGSSGLVYTELAEIPFLGNVGLVGFPTGVGVYAEGEAGNREFGGGFYVNIVPNAGCHK